MNLEYEKKKVINAIYRSINQEDKKKNELYIKIHVFKLIFDLLMIIYILNVNIVVYIKVVLIVILILNDIYIIFNYIYIYTKKDYIGTRVNKIKNTLKLIDRYQNGILVKFNTVWNLDLYGYHSGQYEIKKINYNNFRNIRQINDVFVGVLKNSDIIFLNSNYLIEVDSHKYELIDYLTQKNVRIEQEFLTLEFEISDIYAKLESERKNTKIKFWINKVLNLCNQLSYFIVILVLWKIILF